VSLHPDWRRIFRKAWSVRLMIIAGLLTGVETVLPMFMDVIPHSLFSGLNFVFVSAALVARLIAQKP
jgi:hypothetical protein